MKRRMERGRRRESRLPRSWAAVGVALALAGSGARAESQPIDLATALRLAGARNLSVALARERVREARGQLEQDQHQLFPWLGPGIGYRRHDGNLQDIAGHVFDASKQSGTAAVTLQAQLDLGESIYRMLASKQSVRASEAVAAASQRDSETGAATAYLELSRAEAGVVVADDSVRIAEDYLRQVREAVEAGIAFAGDVPRAELQVGRAESQRIQARGEARLASIRLAQCLHLPMEIELKPALAEFVPVVLVGPRRALDSLVASALSRRPELRGAEARIAGARATRDGTTKGAWLPTVGAQAAMGGLAGGRNGDFGKGDDFQDYGVSIAWRVGPGGLGDRSRTRSADSRVRQAELALEQAREAITREVIDARTHADSAAAQLVVAGRTLAAAERLHGLTLARREYGVGAVMEAIDAERELARARADHLKAIADHNRCQWELLQAAGDDPVPAAAR